MSLFGSGTLLVALCLSQGGAKDPRVITYRNITLYPISSGLSDRSADVITLDEGLKQGTIVITETGNTPTMIRHRPPEVPSGPVFAGGQFYQNQRSASAQVNTLWLTNTSGKTLLLVAGEMLMGGQQDRIVQKDGLIPPTKAPVDLAVFCVEHGRWTAQSTQFGGVPVQGATAGAYGGGGAFAAPGGGRGAAVVAQSQAKVWDSVAGQLNKLGTQNSTGTYRENFVSPKTQPALEEYVKDLMGRFPVQDSAGVAVAVNGRLIWMDRFDTKRTFGKYWPKLLKSYVLEAMSEDKGSGRPFRIPSYREALNYAESRNGKASFEGQEGLSKLTRVESDDTVLYELEDLQTSPGILVHANKATKQ